MLFCIIIIDSHVSVSLHSCLSFTITLHWILLFWFWTTIVLCYFVYYHRLVLFDRLPVYCLRVLQPNVFHSNLQLITFVVSLRFFQLFSLPPRDVVSTTYLLYMFVLVIAFSSLIGFIFSLVQLLWVSHCILLRQSFSYLTCFLLCFHLLYCSLFVLTM